MSVWCYPIRHMHITDGDTPVWQIHLCDTEVELPITLVSTGDLAYSKDTNKWWKYTTFWSELVSGGGGGSGLIHSQVMSRISMRV